jgi:hypothetical protein
MQSDEHLRCVLVAMYTRLCPFTNCEKWSASRLCITSASEAKDCCLHAWRYGFRKTLESTRSESRVIFLYSYSGGEWTTGGRRRRWQRPCDLPLPAWHSMRSLVVQATSDHACAIIDGAAADGPAQHPGAGRDREAQQDCRVSRQVVGERGAGGRSGWPGRPAIIEDVLPGHPSVAWTGMFPERLWEASVSRLGHLTLLEPPRHRRVGNAAYALQVTA